MLIEPHVQGHHGPYLQWIIEGLVEHGLTVVLVTLLESTRHPSVVQISATFPDVVDVVALDGGILAVPQNRRGLPELVCLEFAYWWMFRRWYRQQESRSHLAAVFLPYLDYCLYMFGLLGSPFGRTPWAGIAMRPSFHHPEMGIPSPRPALWRIKRTMFSHLLKNKRLKQILTIDESLAQYLKHLKLDEEKVTFLPQPSGLGLSPASIFSAPRRRRLPESNRKTILMYGALTFRKGIKQLLQAFSKPSFPDFVDIVLAGNVTEEIRPLLSENWVKALQRNHRIILLDRFISENEEQVLFETADIVWLGYLGHFTCSGVLVQAAKAGRPVIACEEGIIGWQTRLYKLGVVVRPTDIDSIINGIKILVDNCEKCVDYGLNGQRAFSENGFAMAKNIVAGVFEPNWNEVA